MKEENLISADEFCIHHNIEFSYMNNLQEFGLIKMVQHHNVSYIPENQLKQLERILRLRNDLEINLEGIDAINNLLQQVSSLQIEATRLKNRLRLYEDF